MYEDIQSQGKCEDACVLDYVSRVGKVIPSTLDQVKIVQQIRKIASFIADFFQIQNRSDTAKFIWKDGIITTACEAGEWIYLKNANFCQSSVLDRLNSLLEREGKLYIYEQGKQEIREVDIDHNFRIFLSYDCSFGEISRAIRNRCLEVSVDLASTLRETMFLQSGKEHYTADDSIDLKAVCPQYNVKTYDDAKLIKDIQLSMQDGLEENVSALVQKLFDGVQRNEVLVRVFPELRKRLQLFIS